MKNLKSKIIRYEKSIFEFVKFGIVGASNTLLYLLVYYVLLKLTVPYILANTIGFIVSVINAYYWNKKYVFKYNGNEEAFAFIKVVTSYGGTFVLSTMLLYILVSVLKVSPVVAPLINLVITIPLNFLAIKFWAFKH